MNVNWNDPNFEGFAGQNPFARKTNRPKKERKPIGTPAARTAINLAVTLLFAAVYYYVALPAINFKTAEFYTFFVLLAVVYCVCAVITSGFQGTGAKGYFKFVKKQCKVPFFLTVGLLAVALVGSIISWEVFRAADYSDLLTVEEGDFAAEVE